MKQLLVLAALLCIAFPQVMVAQSWSSMNGPQVATNVRDVTITADGQTLYATDNLYAMKSTNSGTAWAVTPRSYSAPVVVLVKPDDAAKIVAAKSGQLVYNNQGGGGGTWDVKINDAGLVPLRLVAAVNNTDVMLLGRMNNPAISTDRSIWRSVNAGAAWVHVDQFAAESHVCDFAPYPNVDNQGDRTNMVLAVGTAADGVPNGATESSLPSDAGLWKSNDYGATWEGVALGNANLVSVAVVPKYYPLDYIRIVVENAGGGTYRVRRATTLVSPPWTIELTLSTTISMVRLKKSNNYLFLATGLGVYRSVDEGDTWTQTNNGLGTDVNVLSVAPTPEGNTVLAGTAGSLYRSTDNGNTWTNVGDMDVSSVEAMQSGANQVAWAVTKDNNMAARHDGSSWVRYTVGAEGNPFGAERIYRNPHNGRLFVAGGLGSTAGLYYSINGGTDYAPPTFTYTVAPGSRYYGTVAHPTLTGTMYLFGGGTVGSTWKNLYTSADGGATWSPASAVVGSGNASILDLTVLWTGSQTTMFAALSDGKVYKSADGGLTWGDPILDAGTVARTIAINRNQPAVVYAGGDAGLFKSTTSGTPGSWSTIRTDNIVRVMMHPSFQNSANRLWAIGGSGNNLYKTTDGGTTWADMTSGLATPIGALGADLINFGYSYAGTAGGVFRINEPIPTPAISGTIVSFHPHVTWTALEESDLANPPYDVYKYYQTCPYYCPPKQCGTPSSSQLLGSTANASWYDNTEGVVDCGSGGSGVIGLVGYYVIARENTGLTAQSLNTRFHRGQVEVPIDPPEEKVAHGEERPLRYFLGSNYPNPFNPVTVIYYGLAEDALVSLVVFDVLGREILRLVDERQEAGYKTVTVDASQLASGVYVYKLTAGSFTATKKMVLMK